MWRQIATLVEEEEEGEEDHHVGDDSSKLQIMIVKKEIPLFLCYFIVLLFPTMRRGLNGVHMRNFLISTQENIHECQLSDQ